MDSTIVTTHSNCNLDCLYQGFSTFLLSWPTYGAADKPLAHYITMTIQFTNDTLFTSNYQESVRIIIVNID